MIMNSFVSPLLPHHRAAGGSNRPYLNLARDDAPKIGPLTILAIAACAAVIGWIGFEGSIVVAGVLYGILFVLLTILRADLAFLIIFMQAPLMWDLTGGSVKMAMGDISLVLATLVLLIRLIQSGRGIAFNPMRWPIAIYLTVCVLSTLLNGTIVESVTSMLQMLLYMGLAVFVYANCIDQPRQIINALYGLMFTDVFLSVMMLVLRSNSVLGINKNAMGSELDYAVVIAVEFWLLGTTRGRGKKLISAMLLILGAALIFSLSRGAWLGTVVGILVLLSLHGQFRLALKTVFILTPIVICCWLLLPQQSVDYAVNFSSSAYNIRARYESVAFAMDFFRQSPMLGAGVGLRKMYDATNVIMSTLAETGLVGLVAFLSIFVAMFRMAWKTCRATDPRSPIFTLSAIGAALMAAKFAHGCVDHYWSRVMLPVWAMAGAAVWSFNASDKRRRPSVKMKVESAEPPEVAVEPDLGVS